MSSSCLIRSEVVVLSEAEPSDTNVPRCLINIKSESASFAIAPALDELVNCVYTPPAQGETCWIEHPGTPVVVPNRQP